MVAKVAIFDTLNAGQDRGFGVLVTQPFELLVEEFGVKDFHTFSVSYKRQKVKLEREEGCIPELGWMLSEAGFAGFWGDFRDCGRAVDGWAAGLFCGGGKGGLSEAGFAGFWGIFGIAGERLMVGRRVFFAAGERTDCGGAIIGDEPMYARLSPS